MTIRMLQAWNGLHQQKIVTTLSGSDEAALVAAGIATYDLDGPSENLRMAQLATDAGGNASHIVASDSVAATVGFDVAVYGATPSGVAAAVAAARQNKRVLLISENERIGGMIGWGITFQDVVVETTPAAIVNFPREYFSRVAAKETFGARNHQRFHRLSYAGMPSWFIRAFGEIVAAERNISVIYNVPTVRSVNKTGTKITSVGFTSSDGRQLSVSASAFVDASYCGDLAAAAGCTMQVGRESTAAYSESIAGIVAPVAFPGSVTPDPYVTAGNSGSGLLPYVESTIGTVGAGDGRVMGFCYRICVTTDSVKRGTWPAPDMSQYNAQKYELLARCMQAAPTSYNTFAKIFTLYQNSIDSTVYDMNSTKGISSNYPLETECREYITASAARRSVIRENVKQYMLGLIYWITSSGDSRIPSALVTDIANYGPVSTELTAYNNISPELYVREGRRVVGDYVLKYSDMTLATSVADPIAFGYYQFDAHQTRIVLDTGVAKCEGAINQALTTAQTGYSVPYRVLLPKAAEVTNLLCPGCPSVSRVAWLSTRLEPMLMALGYAAGAAASLLIDQAVTAANVNFSRLKRVIDIQGILDGILLDSSGTYNEGTVTQNPGASWATSTSTFGFVGSSALQDQNAGKGKTLTFAPNIQETGLYRVLFKYPPAATNRSNNVPVTINHALGATALTVNQIYGTGGEGIGGDWEALGAYVFRRGTPSADNVVIGTTGTASFVVASAVKFVPVLK